MHVAAPAEEALHRLPHVRLGVYGIHQFHVVACGQTVKRLADVLKIATEAFAAVAGARIIFFAGSRNYSAREIASSPCPVYRHTNSRTASSSKRRVSTSAHPLASRLSR